MSMCCAFTGHRARKLPWQYDESDPRCADLKRRIADAVESACASGFDRFICGMAEGCDLDFCEAVLAARGSYPHIRLEAAVPFSGQADRWPAPERERYDSLLSQCDRVTVLQEHYSAGCMMRRNRYMVDKADLLIACFDGQSGGTLNTLRYAVRKNVRIVHLGVE